jgi:hypothetical protein
MAARNQHGDKAEAAALARMFRVWDNPGTTHDGRDLVAEALDDPGVRKDIAQLMHGCFADDGDVDQAELGKQVADRLVAYAKSCPRFSDYVDEERADLNDHSDEDEERDSALERESS